MLGHAPNGDNAPTRSLTVSAPAKLNLFLHMTGRRDDGYHLLETLFVALDVCDTITLTTRSDGAIRRVGASASKTPAYRNTFDHSDVDTRR